MLKVCAICHATFQARTANHIYCSPMCAHQGRYRRRAFGWCPQQEESAAVGGTGRRRCKAHREQKDENAARIVNLQRQVMRRVGKEARDASA